MINLNNFNKIFIIGIGGISLSGLAILLKNMGKSVSGSDLVKNNLFKKLKKQGIKVYTKHKPKYVSNCDLVVFSGAIGQDNPQVIYAKKHNIPIIERAELLGAISKNYKNVIAISGTHGKTTTTAMLSYVFMVSGLNPTVHIGAEFDYINGNIHIGGNEYFITEACEFRDSFLKLKPTTSIITNIEPEHLDYFKTFKREQKSFCKFAKNTTQIVYVNGKYKHLLFNNKVKTYGLGANNTISAKNLVLGANGKYSFDCYVGKTFFGNFKLNVFGKHNVYNALATISVCLNYGISYDAIYLGLKNFCNAHRRFEFIGNYKNCPVISDYAHHPTEILTSIKTCKEVFNKKIICIFQPHTYSRTKTLLDGFAKCFSGVDSLYIIKTYSARENYDYLGSAEHLMEIVIKSTPKLLVKGVLTKPQFLKEIKKQNLQDCVLLFLGAGDIEKLPYKITNKTK